MSSGIVGSRKAGRLEFLPNARPKRAFGVSASYEFLIHSCSPKKQKSSLDCRKPHHRHETAMSSSIDSSEAGGVLTIDLDAIVANWRELRERAAPAHCAAVVKAD